MSQTSVSVDLTSDWKSLCKIGGIATTIQLICVMSTMIVLFTLGGEPGTVEEYFTVLQNDRLIGLLRMDLGSIINVALYPLTFLGLYATLRKAKEAHAVLAVTICMAGVVLWLGSHSAFSILSLSDQYAAATTEAQKAQLFAAGQAIIASDMWHSTGALVAGIFMQSGLVVFSIIMLPGNIFSKATAIVGVVTHGLDLLHVVISIFTPEVSFLLMWIAGPLYPIWFVMIARNLFHLSKGN